MILCNYKKKNYRLPITSLTSKTKYYKLLNKVLLTKILNN